MQAAGEPDTPQYCANCQAQLHGPYCAQCGQHAHHSARDLSALLHDGWHAITHVDGRLWRTLVTLLLRPGRLTVEYLADHRERYLPPVRLYLVLAVLFFAVVHPVSTGTSTGPSAPEPAAPGTTARLEKSGDPATAQPAEEAAIVQVSKDCRITDTQSGWAWLNRNLTTACQRLQRAGQGEFSRALANNVPRMMLLFLPVMAAINLLFYWRPRRLYIEHLVFFLHTHAALYLLTLLISALTGLMVLVPALRPLDGGPQTVATLYAFWYLFRAMRVVYGQGRTLTWLKFLLIGCSYALCLAAMFGLTLIWSFAQL